jgi:pimeloyl-ACP methyl ester carboxylesterase
MRRRSILLAPLLLALGGALLLASGCGSMPKGEVRSRLLELSKNAPVAERGLTTLPLRADLGDGERDYELVHLRVPAREPVAGARPLLLIHGTPSTLCNWAPVIFGDGEHPGLAAHRDVHAIELLGHGFAPGSHEPYSFQQLAAFTVAATRALGLEGVHLVGHSYGGEVAWRAALDAPELYATLTLSNSAGYARADDEWLPEEEVMRDNWLADIGWRLNARDRILSALEPHFVEVPPDTAEEFFLVCENADNWRAMIDLVRDENGARQDELGRLAMPVLLLWGERDIAYTLERVAARFAADIPEATLRTVAAGHYPHEERPADYVRELSAFLDDADAAREPQEPR